MVLEGDISSQRSTQERVRFETASSKVKMSTSPKSLQTGTTPGWSSEEHESFMGLTSKRNERVHQITHLGLL